MTIFYKFMVKLAVETHILRLLRRVLVKGCRTFEGGVILDGFGKDFPTWPIRVPTFLIGNKSVVELRARTRHCAYLHWIPFWDTRHDRSWSFWLPRVEGVSNGAPLVSLAVVEHGVLRQLSFPLTRRKCKIIPLGLSLLELVLKDTQPYFFTLQILLRGQYEIFVGRRRFEALQLLNLKNDVSFQIEFLEFHTFELESEVVFFYVFEVGFFEQLKLSIVKVFS